MFNSFAPLFLRLPFAISDDANGGQRMNQQTEQEVSSARIQRTLK